MPVETRVLAALCVPAGAGSVLCPGETSVSGSQTSFRSKESQAHPQRVLAGIYSRRYHNGHRRDRYSRRGPAGYAVDPLEAWINEGNTHYILG